MKVLKSSVILSSVLLPVVTGCASRRVEVRQYGRMHEVLGGGADRAQPCVALDDVMRQSGAMGVGALAHLEGEITILDGRAWVARAAGGRLDADGPASFSSEEAAFLTVAYVDRWKEIPIEQDLAGEELERFIGDRGREAGLQASEPLPFVIEGQWSDLQMHVISGVCPMKPGVRLASGQAPWRHQVEWPTSGTVVGFYAPDSVGNLTHPGTSIHAHALIAVDGRDVTGHVERLAVARGAVLKLPLPR